VQLLRGHILEALENRSLAVECYREALQLDVQCYEALDCLIQHHMLTSLEGFHLVFSSGLSLLDLIYIFCIILSISCK
jgi:anaphase-promoting complex subunit 6